MRESQNSKKVPSLRGCATDLMYTKLPGTMKSVKTFPKLAPYERILCFKPTIFLREACFRWCLKTTPLAVGCKIFKKVLVSE